MNKMLSVCVFSLFSIFSLYSAITTEYNESTQKMSFNIRLNNKQDIFEGVQSLQQIIPLWYLQEVGEDQVKAQVVAKLNVQLEAALHSSPVQTMVQNVAQKFVEMEQTQQNLSLSQLVTLVAEAFKSVEDAHVFGTLHAFLVSSEGKELLNTYEEAANLGLKKVPGLLFMFYILREAACGLQENDVQCEAMEIV